MIADILTSTPIPSGDIGADTLEGAAQIATFLGKSVRQTNNLLETRQLPAFKLGKLWHMRKSTYRAFVERREAEALNSATKQAA